MKFVLNAELGYRRLDTLLEVFDQVRKGEDCELDWRNVEALSPAGLGILACLMDSVIEHGVRVKHVTLPRSAPSWLQSVAVTSYSALPQPEGFNFESSMAILSGQKGLNPLFIERLEEKFASNWSEDVAYSCRLILNELMQNSVDHAGAERYYLYAGLWEAEAEKKEIHFGVLDMGVSIPLKLLQKYTFNDDLDALELATQEGVTTRRTRPGGLGLHHVFEHLKDQSGTLTLVSGQAQIIRYFKNKKVRRSFLKSPLRGAWCMTRIPLEP